MLNSYQLEAKYAARNLFTYGPRIEGARKGLSVQHLPRLRRGIAGYGIAGETVRIYVLDETPDVDIPDSIADLSTEAVMTTGFAISKPSRQMTLNPAPCGVSIGHPNITAGTIGCLIDIASSRYILSNNHVLADTNNGSIGDDILQAGPLDDDDSSNPATAIAQLADFEPVDFSNDNQIDAAIAFLIDIKFVTPDIMTLGYPSSTIVEPDIGETVAKHGRTSGLTFGSIVDVSFDGNVNFGTTLNPQYAWFENQIGIEGNVGAFSEGGDSGSLIVRYPGLYPVGLLFAGDTMQTLANPIYTVLNRFGATVIDQ